MRQNATTEPVDADHLIAAELIEKLRTASATATNPIGRGRAAASGQTHILRSTMKELVARLPDNFVRIHRSTIVNLSKVEVVEGLPKGEAQLLIHGGGVLKVSRNFRKEIQSLLI